MAELPDASVDVVVTSPPYNLGTKYGYYNDDQSRKSHLAWTRQWAGKGNRVLKDGGSFLLNLEAAPHNPWLPHGAS